MVGAHRREALAERPLAVPAACRLAPDDPRRTEILERHHAALLAGDATYLDPATGLSVFTAGFLADRGHCCASSCRHCPYVA